MFQPMHVTRWLSHMLEPSGYLDVEWFSRRTGFRRMITDEKLDRTVV